MTALRGAGLRSDAARNRDLLVRAARELLADRGDGFQLNAVARRAGVGQGTLYRHFATRQDLLAEVYRDDVAELVALAPELLAGHAPFEALTLWFERLAEYVRIKRSVLHAVEAGLGRGLSEHSLGPIGQAMTTLLDAGRADGSVRSDVDARDVMILITPLSRIDQAEAEERSARLLDIVLEGLRGAGDNTVTDADDLRDRDVD